MSKVLVAVQGYRPYNSMAEMNRFYWEQQGYPVVTLSPIDSPMSVHGIVNIPVGVNGYVGEQSIRRWEGMLWWLYTQQFDWYLMHETDSIYLGGALPPYLFEQDHVLWCNKMPENANPPLQEYYCVAPWFFSRKVLEKLVHAMSVLKLVGPPNGDRWLGQLCASVGVQCELFRNGIGCGTLSTAPGRVHELVQIENAVRAGARFIHGVKTLDVQNRLHTCLNHS